MALKFAFSTVACPEWTIEQVAANAKEYGYDAVEIRTLGSGGSHIASDPALTDPEKIRAALDAAGVKALCMSTSQVLHDKDETKAHQAVWQIREQLKVADAMGCQFIRVFGNEVLPGENRKAAIQRIGERAGVLAQDAGELGIQILFENAGSFAVAKDWWTMFNNVEHPMLGVCWNVANAAAAGESPALSVPMLNHRIAMAKVKDTVVGEGSGYVQLGEGTVEVQHFIKRLLGIGYDGYVSVEWDRLWRQEMAPIPAEEYLPAALEILKGWTTAVEEDNAAAQVKIDKAAAKSAPQPRLRAS